LTIIQGLFVTARRARLAITAKWPIRAQFTIRAYWPIRACRRTFGPRRGFARRGFARCGFTCCGFTRRTLAARRTLGTRFAVAMTIGARRAQRACRRRLGGLRITGLRIARFAVCADDRQGSGLNLDWRGVARAWLTDGPTATIASHALGVLTFDLDRRRNGAGIVAGRFDFGAHDRITFRIKGLGAFKTRQRQQFDRTLQQIPHRAELHRFLLRDDGDRQAGRVCRAGAQHAQRVILGDMRQIVAEHRLQTVHI